jgi:hypothetical protein
VLSTKLQAVEGKCTRRRHTVPAVVTPDQCWRGKVIAPPRSPLPPASN